MHENHVRQVRDSAAPILYVLPHALQALAACAQFRIDACFFCPNADQGNDTKSIGVSQAIRVRMLQQRFEGQHVLRVHDCGGRGWNWEGR